VICWGVNWGEKASTKSVWEVQGKKITFNRRPAAKKSRGRGRIDQRRVHNRMGGNRSIGGRRLSRPNAVKSNKEEGLANAGQHGGWLEKGEQSAITEQKGPKKKRGSSRRTTSELFMSEMDGGKGGGL